jgi:nucleoside-triphosphatase THEP1
MSTPTLDVNRIEKIPWSILGPEFIQVWGYANPSDPQPEHIEVIGQNGSGKSFFVSSILQERMLVRNTSEIQIITKPADATALKLGWPIVDSWEGVRENRQCIFWPRTDRLGKARKVYQEAKIQDLLNRLWHPNSNTVISFDEIAYIESLSGELRATIEMYWREARSQGISMVATKQRPQGTSRHMHSETQWSVVFVPADYSDRERFAELLGSRREWMPVFDIIDPMNNEFVIRHTRTGDTFISWIDIPLVPIKPREDSKGISQLYREPAHPS